MPNKFTCKSCRNSPVARKRTGRKCRRTRCLYRKNGDTENQEHRQVNRAALRKEKSRTDNNKQKSPGRRYKSGNKQIKNGFTCHKKRQG